MTTSASTEGTTPLIVVGVDGSDPSKEALRWALREAELMRAAVRVVLVWHQPLVGYPDAGPYIGQLDMEQPSAEALKREVIEVAGPAPSIPITTELVSGHPAPELIRSAKDATLLVVGSRGHGAFAGMLLGSVSAHCVTHAPCPVVVVRTPGA